MKITKDEESKKLLRKKDIWPAYDECMKRESKIIFALLWEVMGGLYEVKLNYKLRRTLLRYEEQKLISHSHYWSAL